MSEHGVLMERIPNTPALRHDLGGCRISCRYSLTMPLPPLECRTNQVTRHSPIAPRLWRSIESGSFPDKTRRYSETPRCERRRTVILPCSWRSNRRDSAQGRYSDSLHPITLWHKSRQASRSDLSEEPSRAVCSLRNSKARAHSSWLGALPRQMRHSNSIRGDASWHFCSNRSISSSALRITKSPLSIVSDWSGIVERDRRVELNTSCGASNNCSIPSP